MTEKKEIDYIINNYNNNSFREVLFHSPKTIMNYKMVMWWLPIGAYIITMILLSISFPITYETSTALATLFECILSICSFIIFFIYYFTLDWIYQSNNCKDTTSFDNLWNSVKNSFNISLFVGLGYFIGIFFTDRTYLSANIAEISTRTFFGSQMNNLMLFILGFIGGMLYINPYNRDMCSLNIWCKQNQFQKKT